jgi:glucose-6-phosphate isomerase
MGQLAETERARTMRVRFDYTNAMADVVGAGNGVSDAELASMVPRAASAVESLRKMRAAGQVEWMDLPYQGGTVDSIVEFADEVAASYDAFVVLGIGGSALGSIALHTALNHLFYNQLPASKRANRPRIYVLDNIDPDLIAGALELIDPARTVFNVVTKSGSTGETMAQLALVREQLRSKIGAEAPKHIVATTDPKGGDLRRLAEREGYRLFDIPPSVGGRFSVLSAVGLLPAAVTGIDVRLLLEGAATADAICGELDLWSNPAVMNASILYMLGQQGKNITVMMPYSQRLRDVADWFRQLWAESLGKTRVVDSRTEHVGLTPVKALGVTDQHSQVQLYMDGPSDKVFNFVGVERFSETVAIPESRLGLSSLDYLGGHSFNELINAERLATELALTTNQRPNCTFTLPEINAHTVGQLMYMLEVQTALIGDLMGINPFDQPGVEAGKVATYALMGRAGYEHHAREIRARMGANRRVI